MIKSFRDKEAEKIFNDQRSLKLPRHIQGTAYRKLRIIHNAKDIRDIMALPGNRYEELKGNRKGQSSVRINDKYRICFLWHENDAYDVEITDYR
ncbi:MAG: type II toxin-antitoxin system RelE/ParE family toxin [Pelolinea sp.]|nr:type II toxin-antitoxin system RelE/ParE family toxin [Pelolinea sp.]